MNTETQTEISKKEFYAMGIRQQNGLIKKNIHRLYAEKYNKSCAIKVYGSTGTATGNVKFSGSTDQEKTFLWDVLRVGGIILYDSKLFWINKLSNMSFIVKEVIAEKIETELEKLDEVNKALFELSVEFRSDFIIEARNNIYAAQRELAEAYETVRVSKIKLAEVPIM